MLERDRIAQRWRTGRWDSWSRTAPPGTTASPVWNSRGWIRRLRVRGCGWPTTWRPMRASSMRPSGPAWKWSASNAMPAGLALRCRRPPAPTRRSASVVATGPFQRPVIPAIAPQDPTLTQIHSADYRNPGQLPAGAVLVVGAGSSGVQIADELQRAGREVYLSVGAARSSARGATAAATSAGGWACSACGIRRRSSPAAS